VRTSKILKNNNKSKIYIMCELRDRIRLLEAKVKILEENQEHGLISGARNTIRYRMTKIQESNDTVLELLLYALLHDKKSRIMEELDEIYREMYDGSFYDFMENYTKKMNFNQSSSS
jgi:excinuclease UvrABC ATPase subunit